MTGAMGRLAALGESARAIPVGERAVFYNDMRMFKPTTFEDARGRRIDFLQSLDWSVVDGQLSKDELKALHAAFEEDIKGVSSSLGLTTRLKGMDILFILGWMIPFAIAMALNNYIPILGYSWTSLILGGALFALCSLIGTFLVVKWRCRKLNQQRPFPRTALGFGLCPACFYNLRSLAPEAADGCTVCPECGGAWRLPGGEAITTRSSG